MIKCPKCGAVNKEGMSVCRMCATPLEAPEAVRGYDEKINSLAPTVVVAGQNSPQAAGGPGEITCSKCNKTNDPDWAFCQYCGNQLGRPAAQEAQPAAGRPPMYSRMTTMPANTPQTA